MVQEIAVLIILAIVAFFIGRALYRMLRPKKEDDKYFFRVPGLRNVARTYPYFHDGSVWELDQAIRVMAQTQLGQELDKEQVADIAAFLQSLSGPVPESARIIPELPISVTQTPHPDNQ